MPGPHPLTIAPHVPGGSLESPIQVSEEPVFDVGANVGQFAQLLRQVGFKGYIHSFEPVSRTFKKLEAAASADPKWLCHRRALGASQGTEVIRVTRDSSFSSILPISEVGRNIFPVHGTEVTTEEIEITTLVDFAGLNRSMIGNRWFLKMDTQGYDLQVYSGARSLRSKIVLLSSELSFIPIYDGMPHYWEALRIYGEDGFVPSGFHIVSRDTDLAAVEMDCVLVNRHPIPNPVSGAPSRF
jgi:FkbM family methyltransferase